MARLKRLRTFNMAPLSELHRSISHSIFDDVEDVTQKQMTPMEEPFTPTLPDFEMEEPYTPTEPDCAPTELDSDSEGCVECDSLLKLVQNPPLKEGPFTGLYTGLPVHSRDHQLCEQITTTNPSITSSPVHWSLEERFQQDVGGLLQRCRDQPWFAYKIKFAELVDFGRSLQWATEFIEANCQDWCKFKIGITENPNRRWHDPVFGYNCEKTILWDYFAVIYTSPTSKRNIKLNDKPNVKELKQTSTGMMETLLIRIFEELPNCINRKGSGADCPSEGSPHFCYVVASYAV